MKKRFEILDIISFPLSLIFACVVWVRNLMFDVKILKSKEFDIPILSVGNLNVGGTGKTPHVEYLVRLLQHDFNIATLSRGYKRKTRGFFLASPQSTSDEIGDEPCQIKFQFPEIQVAVDGNRIRGIENLVKMNKDLNIIILDDAFQHRYVNPGMSVLLVDYNHSVFDDFMLPYGRLREFPSARERADIIIVSKCPDDLKPIDQRVLSTRLKMYAFQKVYFTHLRYGDPVPVFPKIAPAMTSAELKDKNPQLLTISGIANEQLFLKQVKTMGTIVEQMVFSDHHDYSVIEMHSLIGKFSSLPNERKYIITTAKDAMKLKQFGELEEDIKKVMYYIPVYVEFHENEEKGFNQNIISYVRNNKPDNILHKPKGKK